MLTLCLVKIVEFVRISFDSPTFFTAVSFANIFLSKRLSFIMLIFIMELMPISIEFFFVPISQSTAHVHLHKYTFHWSFFFSHFSFKNTFPRFSIRIRISGVNIKCWHVQNVYMLQSKPWWVNKLTALCCFYVIWSSKKKEKRRKNGEKKRPNTL